MPKPTRTKEPTEADLVRARFAVRYGELQRAAKRLLDQSSRSSAGGQGEAGWDGREDEGHGDEEDEVEFVVEDER